MRLIPDDTIACLTVWQEARGEPLEGMIGVCEVIRTRRNLGHWGSTYTAVCLAPYQFSGWNSKDPNRIASLCLDEQSTSYQAVCHAWELSAHTDYTLGATHYCTVNLHPDWAKPDYLTVIIGRHAFYKLPQ